MAPTKLEYGPQPEELAHRISQIDLSNSRRRSETITSTSSLPVDPRYTREYLMSLNPITPNKLTVPPSTPNILPHSPPAEDQEPMPTIADTLALQTSATPIESTSDIPYDEEEDDDLVGKAPLDKAAADAVLTRLSGNVLPGSTKKKSKKDKGGKGKNKKPAPTGFEEFYADAPVTPAEYDEETEQYDPGRPLHERIQTCIQRYRHRRSLDSTRSNILTKYFILGGIESSNTKQFTGGLDNKTLEEATAAEIAAIQATDHIRSGHKNLKYYDPIEPEKWVVDFEGVVKGFLSHTAPRRFPLDTHREIAQVCGVIKNFLNYLLIHGVCTEYTKEILAARDIAILAHRELLCISRVRHMLPGDFNIATSTLFGGQYCGIHIDNQGWAAADANFDELTHIRSMSDMKADMIFKTGIAYSGTQKDFQNVLSQEIKIVKTENRNFEVVSISRASFQFHEEYAKISPDLKALGVLVVKPWKRLGTYNEDTSDVDDDDSEPITSDKMAILVETLGWSPAHARQALVVNHGDIDLACDWLLDHRDALGIDAFSESKLEAEPTESAGIETFWIEDEILQHIFLGMKFEVVVRELNIGIKFFDQISGIFCSFYTFLPNENVVEFWKDPILNTRDPPTEDNPDAEEAAESADCNRELESDEKHFIRGSKDMKIKISAPNDKMIADEEVKSENIGPA